jgi:hypothetical protein
VTLTQRLATQLKSLDVPFVDDFPAALQNADHIVDAIFGKFSLMRFLGPFPQTQISFSRQGSASKERLGSLFLPLSKLWKRRNCR